MNTKTTAALLGLVADIRVREHKYGVLGQADISASGHCSAPSVKRCAVEFKTAFGWPVKFSATFIPPAIGAASAP
jgi:hypothetical protein